MSLAHSANCCMAMLETQFLWSLNKNKGNLMGSNQTIALTDKLVRQEDVLASIVEGELVMMNIQSDSFYGANAVGTRIWELLEQPLTVAQLCSLLQEEFDVDAQTCQQDVLPFIQKIIDEKLVRIIAE